MPRSSPISGERRLVTALFAAVVDCAGIAQNLGAEDWTAVMTEAVDRFGAVIADHGGRIGQDQGGGLLAFFGARVAHEDDPLRVVRAAVALVEVARRYGGQEIEPPCGVAFAVRVGANTATAVVGAGGSELHHEYLAMDATQPKKGNHYYWKREFAAECPIPGAQMFLAHVGGALNDRRDDDGAVGNRGALFVCGAAGMWEPDTSGGPAFRRWIRDAWMRLHVLSTGGDYVNFPERRRCRGASPSNLRRPLRETRRDQVHLRPG